MLRAFLFSVLVIVVGCQTTQPVKQSQDYWNSPDWQRATLNTLVFDFREDGDFDYQFPAEVPESKQSELYRMARRLNENWKGE